MLKQGDKSAVQKTFSVNLKRMAASLLPFVMALPHLSFASALDESEQNNPKAWIHLMTEKVRELEFKGHFTYERGFQSSSYQYIHQVVDGQERQRLVFMDGAAQEIINDGTSIKYLHSKDDLQPKLYQAEVGQLLNVRKDFSHVWRLYDGVMLKDNRVAGREVKCIHLKPKDKHRYSYVFAIDEQTGLMLKMMVIDNKSRVLERYRYVQIEYTDITDADLMAGLEEVETVEQEITLSETGVKLAAETIKDFSFADMQLQLNWKPEGFQSKVEPLEENHAVQHTYSDGLSSFSVFIEAVDDAANTLPSSKGSSWRNGGTAVATKFIKSQSNSGELLQATVVGELPMATVKRIVDHIAVQ